jgi:hypothetical protein
LGCAGWWTDCGPGVAELAVARAVNAPRVFRNAHAGTPDMVAGLVLGLAKRAGSSGPFAHTAGWLSRPPECAGVATRSISMLAVSTSTVG